VRRFSALKNYRQSRFTTDESKAFGGTVVAGETISGKTSDEIEIHQ
jgi:DNA segregation ATPase FtsK/SpoIIIE-like protein